MSRDHSKLRVFHEADNLAVAIYKATRDFPRDEWFGLRAQMCRASVSVPTNLVEGSAGKTTKEYLKFRYEALGSGCELSYLVGLASRLGYAVGPAWKEIQKLSDSVAKQLQRLVASVEQLAIEETKAKGLRRTSKHGALK